MAIFLQGMFRAVRKAVGLSSPRSLHGLRGIDDFQSILERERARTDRSGDAFSLLVFFPEGRDAQRHVMGQLASILHWRLRATDDAGWIDDRSVGVLLPSTGIEGASTVANDILMSFPAGLPLPEFRIYHYPLDQLPSDTPPSDQDSQRATEEPSAEPIDAFFVKSMPAWKRSCDVAGALFGLTILTPLFVFVALAIKLTSPGPVFFRQWRSGRGGKPFQMVKFRSMVVNAEAQKESLRALNEQDGPAFKIKRDPRVTRIGWFIRVTSIDELPQLWNVLRGDMSLVGPRPLPCNESDACLGWQRRRLDVTPGLTCIWQVKGRSRVSFAEWVRMDIQYIQSRSPLRDLLVLLQTFPALVFRRGS